MYKIGLVERHNGYKAEEHRVMTYDGYILVLHRITASPVNPKSPGKPVVFLEHALGLSSDSFVLFGPGKDLGKFFFLNTSLKLKDREETFLKTSVFVFIRSFSFGRRWLRCVAW